MENFFWLGLVGAVLALLFAVVQSRKVMSFSEGNDTMKKIAASIRQGANASSTCWTTGSSPSPSSPAASTPPWPALWA